MEDLGRIPEDEKNPVTLSLYAVGLTLSSTVPRSASISVVRVPNGGIQQQAPMDNDGTVELRCSSCNPQGFVVLYWLAGLIRQPYLRHSTFSPTRESRLGNQPGTALHHRFYEVTAF